MDCCVLKFLKKHDEIDVVLMKMMKGKEEEVLVAGREEDEKKNWNF